MYKGLGFEPIMGKDGHMTKVLVRTCSFLFRYLLGAIFMNFSTSGSETGDVHCVTFENGKSDRDYAELLWKLASS